MHARQMGSTALSRALFFVTGCLCVWILQGMVQFNVQPLRYPSRKCKSCNEHSFTFDETLKTTCESDVFLLVLVVSHPAHRQVRATIRKTWASVKSHGNHSIQTVFLVGKMDNHTNVNVSSEAKTHRDMVIINMQENYYNLTEKTLVGLQWVVANCKHFQYLLKTDDDTYNNLGPHVEFLQSLGYPQELVSGFCSHMPTNRVKGNKWYTDYSDHPGYYLPVFCRGPAYILSRQTAEDFLRLSRHVRSFKLEDVYLTGFVREEYGIEPVQMPHIYPNLPAFSKCQINTIASVHRANHQMLWNWTKQSNERPLYCIAVTHVFSILPVVKLACIVLFIFLVWRWLTRLCCRSAS